MDEGVRVLGCWGRGVRFMNLTLMNPIPDMQVQSLRIYHRKFSVYTLVIETSSARTEFKAIRMNTCFSIITSSVTILCFTSTFLEISVSIHITTIIGILQFSCINEN